MKGCLYHHKTASFVARFSPLRRKSFSNVIACLLTRKNKTLNKRLWSSQFFTGSNPALDASRSKPRNVYLYEYSVVMCSPSSKLKLCESKCTDCGHWLTRCI